MSSNSWWRRAAGQSFNPGGAAAAAAAAAREPRLVLPHLAAPDIGWVDWAGLRRLGFDKDNTLTAPYCAALWPPLAPGLLRCRDAFPPGALAVFSNSAGLRQFDPDGSEANLLEGTIGGIRVIRD